MHIVSIYRGELQLSKGTLMYLRTQSHRRLNKHSMGILAVEGPAGLIVHCVNQSLEAHWLHSSLVYFKAKGWAAAFRGASTLPPNQQAGRFTQSQCSHQEFTLLLSPAEQLHWRDICHFLQTKSLHAHCNTPTHDWRWVDRWKSCKTVMEKGHYDKTAYDSNNCILCARLMAKIPP